ncbi:helix-turn-helix domain-containing GNAT family N-acetyltransferase [Maridesulfovibrio sp.]|uniref:bifunctional helix-turn-helix transcriptional regulator/GNAT family N-acetyltransferase n=1 Tax=Maridesulfovibrio sp. TaxID=2795000 RepID=UPI002A18AE8A|nr:helix-turn-helix domain-containing GNAT family N-acetyltransferase [Maridesulfovibrio sp.]
MTVKQDYVERVRSFNRFYTQVLGLLHSKLLKSEYSLAEGRVLFELGQVEMAVAKDLSNELMLDPAYLSRLLSRFEKKGLIVKKKSSDDSRRQYVSLTSAGEVELARLQDLSNSQIKESLSHADSEQQKQLVAAMGDIERIFNSGKSSRETLVIRPHKSGDIGIIAYKHAAFYSERYGFDVTFDAYVASALSEFVLNYNSGKEYLWVVEEGTTPVAFIAIVMVDDEVAQLRWFLVDPHLRGNGIGKKLLSEAVEFCRSRNYKKIILWTVENLQVARKLYGQFGFEVSKTKTHEIWGQHLTEELWELQL